MRYLTREAIWNYAQNPDYSDVPDDWLIEMILWHRDIADAMLAELEVREDELGR